LKKCILTAVLVCIGSMPVVAQPPNTTPRGGIDFTLYKRELPEGHTPVHILPSGEVAATWWNATTSVMEYVAIGEKGIRPLPFAKNYFPFGFNTKGMSVGMYYPEGLTSMAKSITTGQSPAARAGFHSSGLVQKPANLATRGGALEGTVTTQLPSGRLSQLSYALSIAVPVSVAGNGYVLLQGFSPYASQPMLWDGMGQSLLPLAMPKRASSHANGMASSGGFIAGTWTLPGDVPVDRGVVWQVGNGRVTNCRLSVSGASDTTVATVTSNGQASGTAYFPGSLRQPASFKAIRLDGSKPGSGAPFQILSEGYAFFNDQVGTVYGIRENAPGKTRGGAEPEFQFVVWPVGSTYAVPLDVVVEGNSGYSYTPIGNRVSDRGAFLALEFDPMTETTTFVVLSPKM
jgi:hypothetical protein